MLRVVGCDPGTSSLDLLLLVDGAVAGEATIPADDDGTRFREVLTAWAPVDLVAGPSGYGLPLVRSADAKPSDIDRMALVRPDDREHGGGVRGFKAHVRALLESGLPAVFLPGVIHLSTIPPHRKLNTIDLGTPDKLCVAALALWRHSERTATALSAATFAVVEVGTAFTSLLIVAGGQLVDGAAGTRGPVGLGSSGAWDGEVAYVLSPLTKADLFRGGLRSMGRDGPAAFRESLIKHLAGLKAVTPFETIYLSGKGLEDPRVASIVHEGASLLGRPFWLEGLPDARVKHAAQGAALLADGLAGGRHAGLVESLELRGAYGTIGDGLRIRPEGCPSWLAE
jgi:predicted butyrate kinase (DUF1464 family)